MTSTSLTAVLSTTPPKSDLRISVRELSSSPTQSPGRNKPSAAYKVSFKKIVIRAEHVRAQPVSAHENEVTTTLAGPFLQGGLLVLLQEPLWNHPWSEGVDAVISGCATLNMLREGIWIASHGTLNLVDHVSVLDRWPLLPKGRRAMVEKTRPEELASLDRDLLQAIRTKKPDVILCMGKIAKEFLQPYLTQLLSTAPNGPEVIYTIHPSYSANYKTGDCLNLREDVLGAIRQACSHLESTGLESQQKLSIPKLISLAMIPSLSSTGIAPARARDVEIIREFLDVMARMCYPDEKTVLPLRSIRADKRAPKSYFAFTDSQTCDLRHCLVCEDFMPPTAESDARRALIPIFLRLNYSLTRISYFLPVYKADWDRISMVLSDMPEDLENLCMEAGKYQQSLDRDVFSVTELFDQLPFPGFDDECARSIARLERITWRLQTAKSRTTVRSAYTRSQSRAVVRNAYIGVTTVRPINCRCTTRLRFSDLELTRAFDAAYVPEHNCNNCNIKRRG